MSFFFSYFRSIVTNRSFPQQDPIKPLYPAINWSKSLVGGSYALKQFTGDNGWNPNDVDIFVGCVTDEEFQKEAKAFQEKSNLRLLKYSQRINGGNMVTTDVQTGVTKVHQGELDSDKDNEVFHDFVKGSQTFYSDTTPGLKIQLVHINTMERPLGSILGEITDVPSCVSYHVEQYSPRYRIGAQSGNINLHSVVETKVFHIPEKGLEGIMTGRTAKATICASRIAKYKQRGYEFYD